MFGSKLGARRGAAETLEALGRSLAVIEFTPKGTILWANENFCRVMGYPLSEIKGRHHSLFVEPEYASSHEYKAFWSKLGRGEFDAAEYRRLGKGGQEVWIQASYNPVTNDRGQVTKVVKVATDVTADKLKNAEFEGKLTAISRVQAVIEFTPAGEIITANPNFLRTVGYELSEVQGKHHRMFVEPGYANSAEYTEFWRKLNAGEFAAAEFKRLGKGGKEVWIQASYNPIFDTGGRVVKIVKFATDITDRVYAVTEIGDGLEHLASNDLEHRLQRPFGPSFEKLRLDFNQAGDRLQAAMSKVADATGIIQGEAQQISASSDDLSRRTEQQAASLEETAAALDEITATVKWSAEGAAKANRAASEAKADAARSGEVVSEAIAAIGEIEQSSDKITQIIGVIDEIAFQTNLLALNAGVEAARAGDAGRGFAVVAQEVRALAQRAAGAAKEIKVLIASSSEQVKRGVKLVGDTGGVLGEIVGKVAQIDSLIGEMAQTAQEQATGLAQVNTAMNQIDQVTQQNAAMVEEATAAAAGLRKQAEQMAQLMAQFKIGRSRGAPAMREAANLAGRVRPKLVVG